MTDAVLSALLAGACAGPTALHEVVLEYDEAVGRAESELLLLNVARAHQGRPVHFTSVSGIAATFDFTGSVGLAGELSESPGLSLFTPSLGFSASENPTISIVPVQGEEFTRRLLTPLDESRLAFFLHQGVELELLLRLLAEAVFVEDPAGGRAVHANGSPAFEALIERLARLDEAGRLDIGELVFEERWPLAGEPPGAAELAELLERGYRPRTDEGGASLARRVIGRHAALDRELTTLSDAEAHALHESAQRYPAWFVRVELAGAPPLSAWIKLRSLAATLAAVARGIGEAAPVLEVRVADAPPAASLYRVRYDGAWYVIPRDPGGRNAVAFDVLYRIYQMAVADLAPSAAPPITIAK